MLLSRYLQERRLFSVDTLRVEVSRKEICQNSVFSEVTLRLRNFGIFCRADTSLSLVSPCLSLSRSFLIGQSQFRKFRNVSEGNFGGAWEDLERQRLGPTLSWLKIWRTVLFLVGQL